MSVETDLKFAYQIGYDDALAGRKPESSKALELAPEKCRMERDNAWSSDYEWHCTECGEHVSTCNEPPRFCPSCGRKVMPE